MADDTGSGKLTPKPSAPHKRVLMLRQATSESNAGILTDLREIAAMQISFIKHRASQGIFSPAEAETVAKMAKVYKILATETDREHDKYGETAKSMDTAKMEALIEAQKAFEGDPS